MRDRYGIYTWKAIVRILICGASTGLGLAIAEAMPTIGDEIWMNSRRPPRCLDRQDGVTRHWLPGDLALPSAVDVICSSLKGISLDGFIFCTAVWESDEDLLKVSTAEIYRILSVNAASFVALARGLSSCFEGKENARLVAIGSSAGLENAALPRVAYCASKFALRGAVHGLREFFRESPVGVTVISPGALASDVDVDDGAEVALHRHKGQRIPSEDIISVIRMLFHLSPGSTIKEISMPARMDLLL